MNNTVKYFLPKDFKLSHEGEEQLDNILDLPDVKDLVVLPDAHYKEDSFAIKGFTALCSEKLYPFLLSKEIGCGIRAIKTDLSVDDCTKNKLDELAKNFTKILFDRSFVFSMCGQEDYKKLYTEGLSWVKEKFSLNGHSGINLDRYNGLLDINKGSGKRIDFIPHKAFIKSYKRLGILGGGNHFLEIQVVEEIVDQKEADRLGLKVGQIIIMFHAGGELPAQVYPYYEAKENRDKLSKKIGKNIQKLLFHLNDMNILRIRRRIQLFLKNNMDGIDANSPEGVKFLKAVGASVTYCFLNRCIISEMVNMSIQKTFGSKISLELISDVMHESINSEEYNGKNYWVHRNGGIRVLKNDILPLPGFMGGPSFICVVKDGVEKTYNTVNHGIGRIIDKADARGQFSDEQVSSFMKDNDIHLYRVGKGDLREQAPFAFKDIPKVIDVLGANNLSSPVVHTRPLAVFKG